MNTRSTKRRTDFSDFGALFSSDDIGEAVLSFLTFVDIPSTLSTSRQLNLLARRRVVRLLEICRVLVNDPFNFPKRILNQEETDYPRQFANRSMGDEMAKVVFSAVAQSGALHRLKFLDLGRNKIGDDGIKGFSDAIVDGAFPKLVTLRLTKNCIGDEGISRFASAVSDGKALVRLKGLYLNANNIGDVGMGALSDAFARRALVELRDLHIGSNPLGDIGFTRLVQASRDDGALEKLEVCRESCPNPHDPLS